MSALGTNERALAHDVRLAVMRLARRLRLERPSSGLTLTQLSALVTIEQHGPLSPGELAVQERVRPPSMTRVIAALEEARFARRDPHPTDGRQSLVTLTPAGADLLGEDRRRRQAWLSGQVSALSREDQAALRSAVPVLESLARS